MKISPDLVLRRFENDLNQWKPIPFWSWNDKLEPEELCRQIDWMKKNEIGGFFMHARGGLQTPYMEADEYDQLIADPKAFTALCEMAKNAK